LSVVIVLLALSAATASGYRVGQNAWIVLCGLWGITLTHMGLERFAAGKISRTSVTLDFFARIVRVCGMHIYCDGRTQAEHYDIRAVYRVGFANDL
jgi:hypothetical protein